MPGTLWPSLRHARVNLTSALLSFSEVAGHALKRTMVAFLILFLVPALARLLPSSDLSAPPLSHH